MEHKLEVFNVSETPFKTHYGILVGKGGTVFSHDSSETYRHNTEVCQWILDRERLMAPYRKIPGSEGGKA